MAGDRCAYPLVGGTPFLRWWGGEVLIGRMDGPGQSSDFSNRNPRSVVLVSNDTALSVAIGECLCPRDGGGTYRVIPPGDGLPADLGTVDLIVLLPSDSSSGESENARFGYAKVAGDWAARGDAAVLVLLSSAAVYGPNHRSTEFVAEETLIRPSIQNRESEWWIALEKSVRDAAGDRARALLTLRAPVFVIGSEGRFFSRFVRRRIGFPCVGFDPSLQIVSASGLGDSIRMACEKGLTGVYNLAPRDVVPLRAVLRFLGVMAVPIPWLLQRLLRPLLLRWLDGIGSMGQLEFLRYSNTISGQRLSEVCGACLPTSASLVALRNERFPEQSTELPPYDPFGCDEAFIRARGRTIHRFLEKAYWRIERKGLEHIPSSGPAIIVGPHRGFMPLDGVILVHLITKYTVRVPRFLIHPTLVKFPFQARFFRRIGGILACQHNGDWVMEQGGLMGVFPEGIRGTFKHYRDTYKLGRFGRGDYIHWSLRYRAPIVPFVIVGSAEIFPILARFDWKWFREFMEWPFLPITPTFPWLPIPLPTKWHVQFLPPIDPTEAEAEAEATGEKVEKLIARRVKTSIEEATSAMLAKRKSIFWGSVFEGTSE